ncbi:MAG TPA: hypothetical protein VHK01_12410, partial [Lacipirellulaceae bacterium]|nr:hypothetical protein [Lacipirellulaceae bacterium]
LAAGLAGDAFAFSGGVSHVVTHPIPMTTDAVVAMPSDATAAVRLCDVPELLRQPSWVATGDMSPAPYRVAP